MMQVIEPRTTDAEHINKAQKIMADQHTMSMGDDVEHTEPMQIHTQEHSAQECIFSKKTIAQHRANITCATCHAARNRGSRMRVCARCGRMHCAQCKPPETKCEAKERTKQGTDEQKEPVATTQQREKEKEKAKGKTHMSMAMNNETKKENEDTDALDTFLRKIQERGPAPATMEWIPRTVRPRITTIMIKLLSESAQAAELANENEWDAIRWRTSTLLYAAPSILLSKPKKQVQSDDDGKEGMKESNQRKMFKEIRRRLQLAEKGEWHKLLGNHLEDYASKTKKTKKEEDTGEGSQRARDLQNATSRAQQGNIRGACQALVGRGLAPSNHDTVEKVKSMVAMDVTKAEHKELEDARRGASKLKSKVPEMTIGAVKRRIRVLKAGAAPGSSGLRNNHIRAIAAAPGGLRALTAWIAAWTKGKQGHQEMKAWNAAMIVPIDRDGTRVRPIALTEALVKLAQGTLMERLHRKLRKNAEPCKTKSEGIAQHIGQFSVRTPMGAEVLARIVRGWLNDRPNETLVQLDLSNAYGSVHRHFALRAVNAQLPEMSPMLAAEWASGRTHAWVQSDEGWEQLAVNRGAWQGAPHSNVAFCCALKAATSNSKLAWESGIAGGQYADDCFYHGPAGTVANNWGDLKEKLKEAGLELQDKKSAAYTPNFEDLSEDERKGLHRLLEIVPRADHPPRVLGTIAQNQRWAMTKDFDEKDDPARLAIKRAEAARKLCEAIKEMSVADVEGPSIAAGWAILSKSAARALDFDARLTSSDTLSKAHEILTSTLRDTTEALVGTHLSEEEHNTVSAPGPLGGCSLRAPSNIVADAAFLSSWICTRKAVQEHADAMGRPLLHEPDNEEAEKARANLRQAGVNVDINGKIELSDEAKRTMKQAQWIMKDVAEANNPAEQSHGPAQRTLSKIMRNIAQIEAAERWAHSDEKEKERRPEAGGTGNRRNVERTT